MAESIIKTLAARTEFLGHLEKDVAKNDRLLEETKKEVDELEEITENMKSLGKYPEHESLIPLAKNIYMKGRIVHTGECYLKNPAYPDSYVVLQTLDQTLNMLEHKKKVKEDEVEKVKYAKFQLEERMQVLLGDDDMEEDILPETEGMPKEIYSDKGVASRVGQFYEILEYEN